MGTCIVQVLIYMWLLTMTCLNNKEAVVTMKMLVKSIYLSRCTALSAGVSISRHIDDYADYSYYQLTYHDIINEIIDTFPTSLLTPIGKFLTFLNLKIKAN